ncbi:uncharacterized protein [Ptychodera flava]|uniref:uncharacterized protein n=1 Tax=Ptychodera flava TaxID=63121 RepID=UPI00396A3F01
MATLRVICRRSIGVGHQLSVTFGSSPYLGQLALIKSNIAKLTSRFISISANRHGIIKSKIADVQIPTDVSFPQYVMSDFDKYGDRVALVEGLSNQSYTYRQLKDLVRRCGSGLVRAGFQPGDVCALYKPNSPEYFISFYSVASIGGTVTTVNPLYTADELANQLNHSNAHWLVTIPAFADKCIEAAEKVSHIKGIYVVGDENISGCTPFSTLMKDDGSAFPTNVTVNPMEDVVALPYSSGTTGLPKGVMLTHYNLIANVQQLIAPGLLDLGERDVLLGVLPFFHIYGLVVVLALGLRQGTKLVTLPQFEPEAFLRTMQDHKVSMAFIVPPLAVFLSKHPMVDQYDLSSISQFLCGAAPLGAGTAENVRNRFGHGDLIIRQGYGLTETSPVLTLSSVHEDFHVGSAGMLLPNTEGKIIDVETGETLGLRQDGEFVVRGPQVMKGYLNNIKATSDIIDADGWFHTGDIGHYDETEQFFIVDRVKELIKYKGFQVAPAELEELLLNMPDVQDVAVIGLPDEEAGELPKAYIVPKSDKVTEEDIMKFVEGKVAPHKKLRGGVEFIDQIPKSPSGKILRRVLKVKELQRMEKI